MKDYMEKIQYKDQEFTLVFNLNVMEALQSEYGTIEKWGALTDGADGAEPDAKAVIFGFREMINEGIDIENDERGTDRPFLTLKQVGRIISEIGFAEATSTLADTVINATMSDEKNE